MYSPDIQYSERAALTRSLAIKEYLKQFFTDRGEHTYYPSDVCRAYLDNTYPMFEDAFVSAIQSYGITIDKHCTVGGLTYDYALPSEKLLIEFAHNLTDSVTVNVPHLFEEDAVVGQYNLEHQYATVNANRNGYECIHIFDWDSLPDIVLSLVPKTLVSCANCEVDIVSEAELALFLDLFYFRKDTGVTVNRGYIYLGLYYEGDLIAVMTFGKPRYRKLYTSEIYCMCMHPEYVVAGGWQLLFDTYVRAYHPESVVAFRELSKMPFHPYDEMKFNLLGYSDPRRFWGRGGDRLTEGPRFINKLNIQYTDKYPHYVQNLGYMLRYGWIPMADCGYAIYEWRKDK